jgi:tetratricopeptide (TPR) repeat protein
MSPASQCRCHQKNSMRASLREKVACLVCPLTIIHHKTRSQGLVELSTMSYWSTRLRLMGISDLELDRIAEEQRLSQLAGSLANLGNLYYQQGKYTEAEPLLLRALQLREQSSGSDDSSVANLLVNLGNLYYQQGKYAEAKPLLQRAVQILEQQVKQAQQVQLRTSDLPVAERGVVADFLAIALMSQGNLYYQQGKYAEAKSLYRRALSIWEQSLGPEDQSVAYALMSLGDLYYQQGKYAEAEPLFLRALHIREQAQGPQHSETAETMHDLARLREALGNREEARVWYDRALAVYQQVLGVHHPKTTGTREGFIALLHAMGQHEEAAQLEAAQIEP